MLYTAIILFILAAVFGLINLLAILRDKPTPKPAVFIHGGLAAIALLITIFFAASQAAYPSLLNVSIALFVIAALGGGFLFARDMTKKPLPKWLALLHPIIAATGLVTLIYVTINYS